MKIIIFALTLFLCLYNVHTRAANLQAQELASILQPFVASLDRDLWTFRYEGKDNFQPTNVEDLTKRIGPWANRFWNPDIVRGADTGPGVYVATDPAATATWGGVNPRLFAIKINSGVNILIGDLRAPEKTLRALIKLSNQMGCGKSSTSINYDLGNAVGYFRMNENRECRIAIVEALQSLGVKALSYGFASVPLKNCRTTNTAISIIDSSAISLNELNRYSEDGNIEGQPQITPFVSRLFEEAKSDFYAQSLLENLEVWERYKNAYGFFKNTQHPKTNEFNSWKNKHILKCGKKWSIELSTPGDVEMANHKRKFDPEIKDFLIRMALTFKTRTKAMSISLSGGPVELTIWTVREVQNRIPINPENEIKLSFAQVPNITGHLQRDKNEYLNILKECLQIYESGSTEEILNGKCAVKKD